ncbi:HlyD family type I secretion periplasmic adaptor subunit [Roseobacter denitrificans]|uniref:Membrane fusion protein (MFP) family protein n=2 Tax=Roseobacter denitrificans TaxID=2434 RepID=Q16CK0_ROSDO|nr:putative HlyD family secretion protein [Roseobacter denitrificans OCh 114]AVL53466.1 HlyD family type I secretion periplasmic adaptor subunit [Roseobacter denitrificans]SFF71286.1 type I secretion membrane fusion protein, HlyD family [Roseobacter denitrificans OCh 114]
MSNRFFRKKRKDKQGNAPQSGNVQSANITASPHLSEVHDGGYARSVIWTVVLALAAFFYWSSVTPVYEVVTGEGTIKPEGLSTRIEHLEGGIVNEIAVQDGDIVQPGQLILQLDTQIVQSELAKIETLLTQVQESIERYETISAISFGTLDDTELRQMTSVSIISDINYRLAQIQTIRSQKSVASTEQQAIHANIESLRQELAIQQAQLDRYQRAGFNGSVSLNRREELQRENLRLESSIAQLSGEVRILDARIEQLGSSEREMIAQFRRDAALQLDEKRTELAGLLETRAALDFQIQRSRIVSPVAGMVNAISVQNLGEVVQPGEVIVEIIPSTGETFAEIEIAADRIGGVTTGSTASVKVLTYDFTRYGSLDAVVEHISPSSFTKENGQTVFRVRLGFRSLTIASVGQMPDGRRVTPGMTVVADIKSEGRTILSFLLKPLRVISDRALTEA